MSPEEIQAIKDALMRMPEPLRRQVAHILERMFLEPLIAHLDAKP